MYGDAEKFFNLHAGYSYDPKCETPEQGRERHAQQLAKAETAARAAGITFEWLVDPDIDSRDFSDELPTWQLWECVAVDQSDNGIASLGGIDLGRDRTPDSDPYARVVQAELAMEIER